MSNSNRDSENEQFYLFMECTSFYTNMLKSEQKSKTEAMVSLEERTNDFRDSLGFWFLKYISSFVFHLLKENGRFHIWDQTQSVSLYSHKAVLVLFKNVGERNHHAPEATKAESWV